MLSCSLCCMLNRNTRSKYSQYFQLSRRHSGLATCVPARMFLLLAHFKDQLNLQDNPPLRLSPVEMNLQLLDFWKCKIKIKKLSRVIPIGFKKQSRQLRKKEGNRFQQSEEYIWITYLKQISFYSPLVMNQGQLFPGKGHTSHCSKARNPPATDALLGRDCSRWDLRDSQSLKRLTIKREWIHWMLPIPQKSLREKGGILS